MNTPFVEILTEGGHKNSLGRVDEVIATVLSDNSRLEELYDAVFDDDAWVRMRAIDAFEKICREHPEWIEPYIDRIQKELSGHPQPSIQWHLAQIYAQVQLSETQKKRAIDWLKALLSTTDIDWIVAANSMKTLAHFTRQGDVTTQELIALLEVQLRHKSNAVIKRAQKFLAEFS